MSAIAGEILADDALYAQEVLLRRPDLPGDGFEQLFTIDELPDAYWDDDHPHMLPRSYLANPGHDPRLLVALADAWLDPAPTRSQRWPEWVTRVRMLPGMDDDVGDVLAGIAANPNLPIAHVQRIAEAVTVWHAVASNPSAPPHLLAEAADAATVTDTAPGPAMERLWWSVPLRPRAELDVYQLLAINPATPRPLLHELVGRSARLSALTATNPSLHEATLPALSARVVLNCRNQPGLAGFIPVERSEEFAGLAASTAAAGPTVDELRGAL